MAKTELFIAQIDAYVLGSLILVAVVTAILMWRGYLIKKNIKKSMTNAYKSKP